MYIPVFRTVALSNDIVAMRDPNNHACIELFETKTGKVAGDGKITHNVGLNTKITYNPKISGRRNRSVYKPVWRLHGKTSGICGYQRRVLRWLDQYVRSDATLRKNR
jgi:hypothetical protein